MIGVSFTLMIVYHTSNPILSVTYISNKLSPQLDPLQIKVI